MWALTFDSSRESWEDSVGMVRERVPIPTLDPSRDPRDVSQVIVKVRWAGFCGSDRGIWWRKAFGDMVHQSLDREGSSKRIFGHELLGEIVEMGRHVTKKYDFEIGDVVTTESHIVCGTCHQCRLGQSHVCAKDIIIGVSRDGCFAEYVKLPAKSLWRTNLGRIRPEVAAVQEPFGNAVHACQVTDLRGMRVAILGTGTIGLFAVLIARALGARTVIGVEPNPHHQELAKKLGCDAVVDPGPLHPDEPWRSSSALEQQVLDLTDGMGVDVALEMSGFNSSTNNAIRICRRGGTVVLFGVQNGDLVVQDAHRVVMNGLRLHGVVGRRIWETWHMSRALLENRNNGVQDRIWKVILNAGRGTVVDFDAFEHEAWEQVIRNHPKALFRF